MQAVKYINPWDRAVTFEASPPFIFEKITGTGAEDAQLMTSEPAGHDGKAFSGMYLGDREITVYVHIKGASREELYANRQALMSLLNPTLHRDGALGRLEYANDHGTWWIPAVVKRGPQGATREGHYHPSEQLVFSCPDPYWRDMTPEHARMAYLGGGMRFPIRFGAVRFGARGYKATMYNRGDCPAPVSVEITGPSTEPQIIKVRTGEYIRVKRPLYEGDVLLIDTTPGSRSVTIRRAGGGVETAMGYMDLSSTWFQLDPGDNQLQYQSGDDSQTSVIVVSSYARYGGV